MSMKQVIIGTRASKLAMIQTQSIIQQLQRRWPNLDIAIEQIRTTGDRVTDTPLTQIGGDGVFITEIEQALRERRIDLAVHSLKDLPTTQPAGVRLAIPGPREDVRDALVSNIPCIIDKQGLQFATANVERTVRIGTSSLRRAAQLRALCSQAEILPIRGNVDTRLRKLDAGEYDAIVLAAAGLNRLELRERLAERMIYFPVKTLMPAPGQGALAVELRDEPAMWELLAPLHDPVTQAVTNAERAFMRALGAGCYLPVAAYGEVNGTTLTLIGLVISLDGRRSVRVNRLLHWTPASSIEQVELLGFSLAEEALAGGADAIIQALRAAQEREQRYV